MDGGHDEINVLLDMARNTILDTCEAEATICELEKKIHGSEEHIHIGHGRIKFQPIPSCKATLAYGDIIDWPQAVSIKGGGISAAPLIWLSPTLQLRASDDAC